MNGIVYRLIVDSDSLTITDVTESDAGVYTCIMNTTLDHDSASAELTVVGMYCPAEAISLSRKTNKLLKCNPSPYQVFPEKRICPITHATVFAFQPFKVNCLRVYLRGSEQI